MEDIKVSIIMPVYNSGQYLRPAVDSILSQSMKEFELILVDDGSSDGSEKVCDEYAQAHPEGTFPIVRVIHQENGGICKARNVAFSEARGEYIGFCDHDDIYLPGLIETAYTKAKQYDADVVKWGEQDISLVNGKEENRRCRHYIEEKCYDTNLLRRDFLSLLEKGFFGYIWDAIYKRKFVAENSLHFDEGFKFGVEDRNFNIEMVCHNPTVVTLPQVFYKHYIRKGVSTSASGLNTELKEDMYRTQKKLMDTMEKLCVDMAGIQDRYASFVLNEHIMPILKSYLRPDEGFNVRGFSKEVDKLLAFGYAPSFILDYDVSYISQGDKRKWIICFLLKHKMKNSLIIYFWLRWCKARIELVTGK